MEYEVTGGVSVIGDRFSHATMPIRNLVKNCSYYWGFAALVSYFINHPLYTSPPESRAYICFSLALICQLLNWRYASTADQ